MASCSVIKLRKKLNTLKNQLTTIEDTYQKKAYINHDIADSSGNLKPTNSTRSAAKADIDSKVQKVEKYAENAVSLITTMIYEIDKHTSDDLQSAKNKVNKAKQYNSKIDWSSKKNKVIKGKYKDIYEIINDLLTS